MFPLLMGFLFRCGLPAEEAARPAVDPAAVGDVGALEQAREEMVRDQMAARGIRDKRVLKAMREVPRHLFVPPELVGYAYADSPLPIGHGQTISQPYIVAFMTEALDLRPGDRVLEIGTGSGYQAAVLDAMGCEVYTIEIRAQLAQDAAKRLAALGYTHVHVHTGDGYAGWPEAAPFAGIVVTAAPERGRANDAVIAIRRASGSRSCSPICNGPGRAPDAGSMCGSKLSSGLATMRRAGTDSERRMSSLVWMRSPSGSRPGSDLTRDPVARMTSRPSSMTSPIG